MNGLNETDASLETRAKSGMRFAILTGWTKPYAVCKYRFEIVETGARHIQMPVDGESGEALLHALAHDASLAVIDVEAFFGKYRGYVGGEAIDSENARSSA